MNEFLEQFLIEVRDLAEQAGEDLLALEQVPGDRERLDSAFRSFHTLKGAAAIVEFAAMGRAVHAVEDMLDGLRRGEQTVTSAVIDRGLACLDAVRRWSATIEATGELPADAEAEAIAGAPVSDRRSPAAASSPPAEAGWIDDLRAKAPGATVAVRLTPPADCFFRGTDPLAMAAGLPGLLAVGVAPRQPWPGAADFDPFACNLVITALCRADAEPVAAHLAPLRQHAEIHQLATAGHDLAGPAAALLRAQAALARVEGDGQAGRLGAAARVAINVLRRQGRPTAPVEAAAASGRPGGLAAAIEAALAGDVAVAAPPRPPSAAARTLRIDAGRVDALVRLTGELTVVKNALGHAARLARDGGDPARLAELLHGQHAALDTLTGEMQRAVLAIRVLPLRHVFQRFPLMVRDMAAGLGKSARLVVEGEETEADKVVVEALFEPLVHVLRNALDHGIEDAARRTVAGKPATAVVTLSGRRVADRVIVEVSDDGAGIDPAAIRRAAVARGLASAAAIAALPDEEAIELIFAPGFSTAADVTDVSGRGIGMDAVRAAIGRIGGRVSIASRAGAGTTVRLAMPFSVMMTRVMTVEAGGQGFGIPFDAVVETVQCRRDEIAAIGAAHAFTLRKQTLPLIALAGLLGRPTAANPPPVATIVVAGTGGQPCGLEVERLGAPLDVMLKPMDGLLAGMRGIAGTALLGDGRVLIVLDVEGLLQ